jgi:2-polyprenyl-3-methyl-5-hydroxy-6-metoxy-1,4-benzoquinol methylase
MLISSEYRELNRQLHEARADYGVSSAKWAEHVRQLAGQIGAQSILDYGCGKGALRASLGEIVREYDPAIPGKDAPPTPADLVLCTDVLEHIEPGCLDSVLDDLRRVTLRGGFFTVATRKAEKSLADGRNAHLIVQPAKWWLPKLMDRFDVLRFEDGGGEFAVIVRSLSSGAA